MTVSSPGELRDKARALTEQPPNLLNIPGATRTPYFCSASPHNTSTKVPEGSTANSIDTASLWMGRDTGYAQMGGEGVPHLVASMANGGKHVFQTLASAGITWPSPSVRRWQRGPISPSSIMTQWP